MSAGRDAGCGAALVELALVAGVVGFAAEVLEALALAPGNAASEV